MPACSCRSTARCASATRCSRSRHGSKPVDFSTASYQYGAQTPSLARGPAGQCSMRGVNGICSKVHNARRCASGAFRNSSASMTGGARPVRAGDLLVQRGFLQHADVLRGRVRPALQVRREHLARIADQEHMRHRVEPVVADVRQHVVGHVLLVEHRLAVRDRTGQHARRRGASRSRRRR